MWGRRDGKFESGEWGSFRRSQNMLAIDDIGEVMQQNRLR